jgi:hypothetical protein
MDDSRAEGQRVEMAAKAAEHAAAAVTLLGTARPAGVPRTYFP